MNLRSIRFRLAFWHAVFLGGVFGLLGVLLAALVRSHLEATLLEMQSRRARQIAETLIIHAPETGQAQVNRQIESLYAPESGGRFIRVTRKDGAVVYVSGTPADRSFDPADVPPAGSDKADFTERQPLPDGHALMVAGVRAAAADGSVYLIEVGSPGEPIEKTMGRLAFLLGVGLPLAVLVATGGGFFLVKRALRHVDQIASKAELITQHNLSERLPVPATADEIERLSVSLNHMITRLDDAFQNSKRFVADASHELRTPLTILRGELEGLLQMPNISPELNDRVGNMIEEVDRLGKIVGRLLALSRLDAGEGQAEDARIDLGELAVSTAEQMALLAEDKGISIAREAAPGVWVNGDRARLREVVVNLLDNAIKYTPAGGEVRLRVAPENGQAALEISDTGLGIPAEALPHVFERFYRVDPSRSRDAGGAGLGLAIVKSICLAHGGQVGVQSHEGQGSRFKVELPLARLCKD